MECRRRIRLGLMELPMELVVEILKRVPAKSICRIRCVCKMLVRIVDSPSFVSLHSRLLIDPDSHLPPAPPQFILHHNLKYTRTEEICTIHSLHYDPSSAQCAQLNAKLILQRFDPFNYILQFVFCNLFCIKHWSYDAVSFLIINPLRGEVLRLPPSHMIAQQAYGPSSIVRPVSTGMGFDSITNTYKILCVTDIMVPIYPPPPSSYGAFRICCVSHVLVLGTREWRQIPSVPPVNTASHCLNKICAYGDMHCLLSDHKREGIQGRVHILSFDFKKEEFFWTPSPYILPDMILKLHLINFRGSMAIVDATSHTKIEIWVMKDYSKKLWMLDYSINIHMLELDPRFAFCAAECCEWEHGIIFMNQENTTLFLDLRGPVVTKNLVKIPIEGFEVNEVDTCYSRINSLDGSLISLKSYANLVEAEEPATYSNWSQGEASGNDFFYLTSSIAA